MESHVGPRTSGGWGLGAGQVDKVVDDDDDDELDQVQLQEKVRPSLVIRNTVSC